MILNFLILKKGFTNCMYVPTYVPILTKFASSLYFKSVMNVQFVTATGILCIDLFILLVPEVLN